MTADQINIPIGYRLAPELKTERTVLLMKPSVKETYKQHADEEGVSLNEYINRILEKLLA